MLIKIKNKIDRELSRYLSEFNKQYNLSRTSPILSRRIADFILADGKRVRPILFVIGYLGFSPKPDPGIYRSALSLELLHDFLLVHDDIIDKSDSRRGKPSMHAAFNNYLAKYKDIKFTGQDLAIVAGDMIYAMSIQAFMSINEPARRKENALKKIIDAAVYTEIGECIELLKGANDIANIRPSDIFKIYDYKTAYYTFCVPLAAGAILAGADEKEASALFKYGVYLGRAFQIKDDILGMFGSEDKIGKSGLTDLKEAKKTILIWKAFNNSDGRTKKTIRGILNKKNSGLKDLKKMRRIIINSGSLEYAKKLIASFEKKAARINLSSAMSGRFRGLLDQYSQKILNLR